MTVACQYPAAARQGYVEVVSGYFISHGATSTFYTTESASKTAAFYVVAIV